MRYAEKNIKIYVTRREMSEKEIQKLDQNENEKKL